MKATFIKDLEGFNGEGKMYRLDPPLDGNEFVAVSAVNAMLSRPDTYIFPWDENGSVTCWGELEGSCRGSLDHDQAIRNAGYEINA